MALKKSFRCFMEPYSNEERYWLVNIKNGDVYKIDKNFFETIKIIESGAKREEHKLNKKFLLSLKKIGALS